MTSARAEVSVTPCTTADVTSRGRHLQRVRHRVMDASFGARARRYRSMAAVAVPCRGARTGRTDRPAAVPPRVVRYTATADTPRPGPTQVDGAYERGWAGRSGRNRDDAAIYLYMSDGIDKR